MFKIFINIIFFCFLGLNLEDLFAIIEQLLPEEFLQMADPMTRDGGDPGRDDDDSEEQRGSPGKLPPKKPFYENSFFQIAVVTCVFFLAGFAILLSGDQAGAQEPPVNPLDAARPSLAGGNSANIGSPPESGGADGGSGE